MIESVFITGGSGLLALNWALALRDSAWITLGIHDRMVLLTGVSTLPVGLETVDDVVRVLDTIKPRLVVHAAGLTSVEECEANESLACHVNTELARHVAVACARRALPLVHISTDHLFSGDLAMVAELQPVDPQNVYARTKAAAEVQVLEAHPEALVVRTNFYGWGPAYRRSFSDTIIDSLRRGSPVTLFEDVFYTPILAEVLSRAIHDLVDSGMSGIVHVAGDERISKYHFGLRVAKRFGLDEGLIRPGLLKDQVSLVRRPLDMSLSNSLARSVVGHGFGDVDAHLTRLHEQRQHGVAQELLNA